MFESYRSILRRVFERTHQGVLVPLILTGTLLVLLGTSSVQAGPGGVSGAVFTSSNASSGNEVLAFDRDARGRLSYRDSYATGGTGSGAGLSSQGALALDNAAQHLLVVNAGSDSVSVLRVRRRGLVLIDQVPSGGTSPVSVTVNGDLVYVLNAGTGGNIAGFELETDGTLTPLPGSIQPLSGAATAPAQIGFAPDGRFLVVSERATDTLVAYEVGNDGLPGPPIVTPSAGTTPFGFAFGHRGRLLVSEATGGAAGASTVSSYDLERDGKLEPITSALATTQSAACWLVVTGNGRFAYVTNTGSDTITGLGVARDGSLSLLDAGGVTAPAGDAPIDAALSRNQRFLYVLSGADDTLTEYRVRNDGGLVPGVQIDSLPASSVGLAAF